MDFAGANITVIQSSKQTEPLQPKGTPSLPLPLEFTHASHRHVLGAPQKPGAMLDAVEMQR